MNHYELDNEWPVRYFCLIFISATDMIPELNYLLSCVEKHYGRKLATTSDYESLSIMIEKETGELISSSTLKRLFGYVTMKPVPRKSTLDILARYVGKRTYEFFCSSIMSDQALNSTFFSAKTVSAADLVPGQKVRIGWNPDRVVTLEYLGEMAFEVIESINSKLMKGDRFNLAAFFKGYPLYIAQILRNGEYTDPYMAGMHEGLNMLDVLPLEK